MLSRDHRFHGLGSLRFAYSKGKTVRDGQLALRFVLNNRRKTYRAAVVVSKKVSKSAVVRNRIRRRIYEILRLREDTIEKPYDIIISVFSDQVVTIPTDKLTQQVDKLLQSARII